MITHFLIAFLLNLLVKQAIVPVTSTNSGLNAYYMFIGGLLVSRSPVLIQQLNSRFYRCHSFPPFGLEFGCLTLGRCHAGALRCLLIMAGDVELNPGPVGHSPVKRTAHAVSQPLPSRTPSLNDCSIPVCPSCAKDVGSADRKLKCGICAAVLHFTCLVVPTVSTFKTISGLLTHSNFIFVCDQCSEGSRLQRLRLSAPLLHAQDNTLVNPGVPTQDASTITEITAAIPVPPVVPTPVPVTEPAPTQFHIIKGPRNVLSNFYRFPFVVDGCRFFNVEQAYQYLKALKCGFPDIAKTILVRCKTSVECKRAARGLSLPSSLSLSLMRMLLVEKSLQCSEFKKGLIDSRGKRLLHSTYIRDSHFWCTGLNHLDIDSHKQGSFPGENWHGRLLEDIRGSIVDTPVCHNSSQPQPLCLLCACVGHRAKDCPKKSDNVCRMCRNPGHVARECFLSKNLSFTSRNASYTCQGPCSPINEFA